MYYTNQSPSKPQIAHQDKVNEGTLYKGVERDKENQQGMVEHHRASCRELSAV